MTSPARCVAGPGEDIDWLDVDVRHYGVSANWEEFTDPRA